MACPGGASEEASPSRTSTHGLLRFQLFARSPRRTVVRNAGTICTAFARLPTRYGRSSGARRLRAFVHDSIRNPAGAAASSSAGTAFSTITARAARQRAAARRSGCAGTPGTPATPATPATPGQRRALEAHYTRYGQQRDARAAAQPALAPGPAAAAAAAASTVTVDPTRGSATASLTREATSPINSRARLPASSVKRAEASFRNSVARIRADCAALPHSVYAIASVRATRTGLTCRVRRNRLPAVAGRNRRRAAASARGQRSIRA